MAMRMFKPASRLIYVLLLAIILSGCVTPLTGPTFQPITSVPNEKALIYIFWPDESLRTEFTVSANDNDITILKNSGYFPYLSDPGVIDISANVNFKFMVTGALEAATAPSSHLTFMVKRGKVYFVRGKGLKPKFFSLSVKRGQRLGMSLVSEEIGTSLIQQCQLLPAIEINQK